MKHLFIHFLGFLSVVFLCQRNVYGIAHESRALVAHLLPEEIDNFQLSTSCLKQVTAIKNTTYDEHLLEMSNTSLFLQGLTKN